MSGKKAKFIRKLALLTGKRYKNLKGNYKKLNKKRKGDLYIHVISSKKWQENSAN